MGFFWGVDQDAIVDLLKKLFFDKVRTQKPGKCSLSVLAHGRNRSGVVGLVGTREGALDHRESRERRDKIFAAKTENAAKIFKNKIGSGNIITVFSGDFGRGKTNFWRGGVTSKLASQ